MLKCPTCHIPLCGIEYESNLIQICPDGHGTLVAGIAAARTGNAKGIAGVSNGKVVAVNDSLESSPEMVNQAPHAEGWIVLLEISDPSEANGLLDAAAYQALIA